MEKVILGNTSLISLKTGVRARIEEINSSNSLKLRKLAAFGIMPGSDIIIIQKYPVYILQVGFTQVALDKDIASEITVTCREG